MIVLQDYYHFDVDDFRTDDSSVDDSIGEDVVNQQDTATDTADQDNTLEVTLAGDPEVFNTSDDTSGQSKAKRKCSEELASNKNPRR